MEREYEVEKLDFMIFLTFVLFFSCWQKEYYLACQPDISSPSVQLHGSNPKLLWVLNEVTVLKVIQSRLKMIFSKLG